MSKVSSCWPLKNNLNTHLNIIKNLSMASFTEMSHYFLLKKSTESTFILTDIFKNSKNASFLQWVQRTLICCIHRLWHNLKSELLCLPAWPFQPPSVNLFTLILSGNPTPLCWSRHRIDPSLCHHCSSLKRASCHLIALHEIQLRLNKKIYKAPE